MPFAPNAAGIGEECWHSSHCKESLVCAFDLDPEHQPTNKKICRKRIKPPVYRNQKQLEKLCKDRNIPVFYEVPRPGTPMIMKKNPHALRHCMWQARRAKPVFERNSDEDEDDASPPHNASPAPPRRRRRRAHVPPVTTMQEPNSNVLGLEYESDNDDPSPDNALPQPPRRRRRRTHVQPVTTVQEPNSNALDLEDEDEDAPSPNNASPQPPRRRRRRSPAPRVTTMQETSNNALDLEDENEALKQPSPSRTEHNRRPRPTPIASQPPASRARQQTRIPSALPTTSQTLQEDTSVLLPELSRIITQPQMNGKMKQRYDQLIKYGMAEAQARIRVMHADVGNVQTSTPKGRLPSGRTRKAPSTTTARQQNRNPTSSPIPPISNESTPRPHTQLPANPVEVMISLADPPDDDALAINGVNEQVWGMVVTGRYVDKVKRGKKWTKHDGYKGYPIFSLSTPKSITSTLVQGTTLVQIVADTPLYIGMVTFKNAKLPKNVIDEVKKNMVT